MADMGASMACRFRRGVAPFAFFPKLALAPYFKWTMVTCDYMHAMDLGVLLHQLAQVWWTILPHLAVESQAEEGTPQQKGLRVLKAGLKISYTSMPQN